MLKRKTKVNWSNSKKSSLRTGLPIDISKLLKVEAGDTIEWDVIIENNNEIKVTVKKAEI